MGRNWSTYRKEIIERDGNRCKMFGSGSNCGEGLEVDHILPFAHGGDMWNPSNLQTLCVKHHKEKTDMWRKTPAPKPVRCEICGVRKNPRRGAVWHKMLPHYNHVNRDRLIIKRREAIGLPQEVWRRT